MGVARRLWRDERGSLSILVMSLFITSLIIVAILTDISSVYLAKRSLTQATEAAAQRGSRNLNLESYYRGEYNLSRFLLGLTGLGEKDPGIPIDCELGRRDAINALNDWSRRGATIMRKNMSAISLVDVNCDGYEIALKTSSVAALPFVIPFTGIEKVTIYSSVGSIDERRNTSNYYGLNIGGMNQG
jgi:hypothetical protein